MKFELYGLTDTLYKEKMRHVFKSLINIYDKENKEIYLKCIPSNYGYVFFTFLYLDNDVLEKYYKKYISKKKLTEIEMTRKEEGEYFYLKDNIEDVLSPLVYDHADVIGEGFAEVYLAIIHDVSQNTLEKEIEYLKKQINKLEKVNNFYNKHIRGLIKGLGDMEINFKKMEFIRGQLKFDENIYLDFWDYYEDAEERIQKNGWEIRLLIYFNGNDTLKEVVERIDRIISPLKRVVNKRTRWIIDSFYPF